MASRVKILAAMRELIGINTAYLGAGKTAPVMDLAIPTDMVRSVSIGSSKPAICVAVISVSASNSKPLRLATRTRYDGFGLAGKQEQLEQLNICGPKRAVHLARFLLQYDGHGAVAGQAALR